MLNCLVLTRYYSHYISFIYRTLIHTLYSKWIWDPNVRQNIIKRLEETRKAEWGRGSLMGSRGGEGSGEGTYRNKWWRVCMKMPQWDPLFCIQKFKNQQLIDKTSGLVYTPAILVLGKWGRQGQEFKVIYLLHAKFKAGLGYIWSYLRK